MSERRVACGVVVLALSLAVGPRLAAHHSFAAEYDASKAVSLTGVVTKLEWTNPHARVYLDVKGSEGAVTNWEFELGSVNMLIRYKFTKNTISIGETVTIEGFLAKDGSALANAKIIKLADGRVFSAGSSDLGNTK
jgi:hypothetical protein